MMFTILPAKSSAGQELVVWNTLDFFSLRQKWLEESAFRILVLMQHPMLLLVLYTLAILRIAGACSSRSTPRPRPPPQPTMRPNITFQTYACPEAYAKWYCLNGATCFSVKIGESILYNCECADGYVGQRCEFKDLEGSYLASRQQVMIETASIAGGITLLIIILVVVCVAVYVHIKKKRKEQMHPVTPVSQAYEPFSAFRESDSHIEDKTINLHDPECGHGERHHVGATVHSASSRARTSL
ncbi:protein spitz isoform X2 [Parasteatoda tepidariorum]|uniref:protein spitz isoform X2 n=1 Tax=Parasteatoda tepidariorum TaxID=114398 RepID=UPI00077FA2EC|nr:protein spitz [Parasteatoda tepidariorum]XP_042908179.1 protein spitz [Parasteatoda tepidariorum]